MTAALLGGATATLIVWAALVGRRDVSRISELRKTELTPSDGGPLTGLGMRALGVLRRNPHLHRHFVDGDAGAVGMAIVVAVPLAFVKPSWAVVIGAALLARPSLQRAGAARRRQQQIESELPLMTELLRIGIDSGLNIPMALQAVSARVEGPLSDELRLALRQVANGRRIADALEDAGDRAGDATRPLIGGLIAAERYGAPLSATLERLALESRADQSRRAVRSAKRLTIYLLFPLAGCTLPAFALLTMAPLLAGSLGSLAFFD